MGGPWRAEARRVAMTTIGRRGRIKNQAGAASASRPAGGYGPPTGGPYRPSRKGPYSVRRRSASRYFSDVLRTTSGGSSGAGGSLFQPICVR